MSIDPDVATTNQPYVFTNDDPLNTEEPLGLCFIVCLHSIAHVYDVARHKLAAGLDEDRVQGSSPPFFFGGLKSGSSAQEARAELSDIGIEVPEGYVAWPANNGRGWNFSPADDVGTERNLIRAMDSSNNPELYPYGDANVYDAAGNPVNALGLPPTSRADWHQPFKDFASNPAAGDELDGGGD